MITYLIEKYGQNPSKKEHSEETAQTRAGTASNEQKLIVVTGLQTVSSVSKHHLL